MTFVDGIERHPIVKLFGWVAAIFSILVLYLTYEQISADLADRQAERIARQEEREDRAFARLRERTGGDTGKGWAMNVLLSTGTRTVTLDVSCKAVGDFNQQTKKCDAPPIYRDVRTSSAILQQDLSFGSKVTFGFSGLESVQFIDSVFDNSHFISNIKEVKFFNSSFIGSVWNNSVDLNTLISTADLSFSDILSRHSAKIVHTNVSGVRIYKSSDERMQVNGGTGNWAWADYPPSVSPGYASEALKRFGHPILCDPAFRKKISRSVEIERRYPVLVKIPLEVTGTFPQLSVPWKGPGRCPSMSLERARQEFPSAYHPRNVRR